MTPSPLKTLAIVGIGLIGGSLARAAIANDLAERVVLFDQSEDVRSHAHSLALGDVVGSLSECVRDADMVILCVPVGALGGIAQDMAPDLKPGAIVTDVGSVKAGPAAAMAAVLPDHVFLIPGHPIAGTERSGPDAGFATLFEDRWCILTPVGSDHPGYGEAVAQLTRFWKALGSDVEVMDPKRHDLVLAVTSHLPHLIAFNIVSTAQDMEEVTSGEVVSFSAGGFRDFTRIAASDPVMWRDVFLHNKYAVLEVLGRFSEDLSVLARAIRWDDGETLETAFARARGIRRSIIDAGQDSGVVNFGRDKPDT